MNDLQDADLASGLRREFDGPIADEGFAARVMRALPPRRKRRAWPLPAAALAGALLAWLALASSALGELAVREWLAADLGTGSAVLLALLSGVVLLACAWALEEGP